jgi:hypothetical protein
MMKKLIISAPIGDMNEIFRVYTHDECLEHFESYYISDKLIPQFYMLSQFTG